MAILKKIYLIAAIVFLGGCAPETTLSLGWQDAPINADGIAAEWKMPLRFFDKDTKLNYEFTNDSINLYFSMKVPDELVQIKILRAGMVVAIDTAGKKNYPVNLIYPVPGASGPENTTKEMVLPKPGYIEGTDQPQKPDKIFMKRTLLASQNQIELKGFQGLVKNGNIPLKNDYGIQVGIDWDKEGIMYYEGLIPFKAFYKSHITAADTAKAFRIQITIEEMEQTHSGPPSGGGMSVPPSSGGMGSGGGMMGGPPGGSGMMPDNIQSGLSTTNVITLKAKLTLK
jgi:hypothetical protein